MNMFLQRTWFTNIMQ